MAALGASQQDVMVGEAPTEPQKVLAWRLRCFLDFGCDLDIAAALSVSQVGLREFERMVLAGCEPEVAARIML